MDGGEREVRAGANVAFARSMASPVQSPGVRRLLLVDDEPDILETVAELVDATMPGVAVTPVPNGFAALEALERGRFDAVLTDFKMPGMDGAVLIQRIRERWPDLPALMFTAFMDTRTLAEIHDRVPGLKIIPKPLDVEFLLKQLGMALAVA
jgi:CheY-like chemotaxis protein